MERMVRQKSRGLWILMAMLLFAGVTHAQTAGVSPPAHPPATTGTPATGTPAPLDGTPTDAELGEAAPAVHDLKSTNGKTLIFVYDVSGSMKGANMSRAREAAINILREATNVGDRVVLYTFGAGTKKVFDRKLAIDADKNALIEQIPYEPQAGAGTNIRYPHHQALKLLDAEQPKPGAVVLLTDSFNDTPKADDPAYAEYVKYYVPGDRLTKYPDTPENRDYERLLNKLVRSRKVNAYGIGVQIDEAGRPVEQMPKAAPEPVTAAETPAEVVPVKKEEIPAWLWPLLGLVAAGLVGGFVLMSGSKPVAVRVTGAPGGAKDFSVRGQNGFSIGGAAGFAGNGVSIPGVKDALATVTAKSGEMRIAPAVAKSPSDAGNQSGGVRVYHNGVVLEKETPLRYGDEVRVTVPDTETGVAKDIRLRFEDPKNSYTKRY